jgi:hypothetical protein
MNFIKKIVDKKIDDLVHLQFQKFSKGKFKDKAIIKVKKTKNKYTINTSPEFANEFVRMMAKKIGNKKTDVTGAIISTSNLKDKLEYKNIKQFQGVKRYLIDKKMTGNELILLLEEFPKTFFGLTFDVDSENKLKIKPKAPKSGKPGKGEDKPKADFCKLITTDKEIGKSFVFEKDDFKLAEIKHDFLIENIILPEIKEKDFAKMRELAKRQGKIVRYSEIDGVKNKKEYGFTA